MIADHPGAGSFYPRAMAATGPQMSPDIMFYFTTSFQDTVSLESVNCPGYLELLPCVYSATASNSALVLATQALAAIFHGAWTNTDCKRDAENRTAGTMFGKALLATQQAISDPNQSKSDETLMAVLILRLYEVRIEDPGRSEWMLNLEDGDDCSSQPARVLGKP